MGKLKSRLNTRIGAHHRAPARSLLISAEKQRMKSLTLLIRNFHQILSLRLNIHCCILDDSSMADLATIKLDSKRYDAKVAASIDNQNISNVIGGIPWIEVRFWKPHPLAWWCLNQIKEIRGGKNQDRSVIQPIIGRKRFSVVSRNI